MKNELNLLFNALLYYTRIPVPKNICYSEINQSKAFRYFPLIGIFSGGIGALVFYTSNFLLPVSISVLFAIGVMIQITGAIHEDGFADFFDGFGGGATQESILRIMKDSHTGVYGSISISLLMLFKYLSLTEIHEAEIPVVLIGAHSISRLFPVYLINFSQYVRTDLCKSAHTKRKIDGITLTIATIIAFLPLVLFSLEFVAVYITVSFAILILYRRYLHKKIGGFTGDTLGAIQQITEVVFYIAYISILKI